MKVSDQIIQFANFFKQVEKYYKTAFDGVGYEDKLSNDLLHAIEFADNKRERNRLTEELHISRKNRRYYKDVTEELYPVILYITDNEKAINRLTNLLGEVRKAEDYHKDRTYRPRIKKEG